MTAPLRVGSPGTLRDADRGHGLWTRRAALLARHRGRPMNGLLLDLTSAVDRSGVGLKASPGGSSKPPRAQDPAPVLAATQPLARGDGGPGERLGRQDAEAGPVHQVRRVATAWCEGSCEIVARLQRLHSGGWAIEELQSGRNAVWPAAAAP